MKKLMIAAAIVCAAVMSQAAALAWSSVAVDKEGNEFTGGQAYLIMVTDAANFAVGNDLKITGGDIVSSVGIVESMAGGDWSTESLTGGETYNFAVLLTTAGTRSKDVGGNFVMPTTGYYGVDKNGDNASPFYQVEWDASTGGFIEPNWDGDYAVSMSTAVAPEPTSGLLLLLGVAGLALKRRRA